MGDAPFAKELPPLSPTKTPCKKTTKKTVENFNSLFCLPQRLPTFPGSCPPSIIGTTELNFCVRYGYRCGLRVIATEFQLNTLLTLSDIYIYALLLQFVLSTHFFIPNSLGQALGLLVSLSLIHYCTYTCDLSTT